MWKKLKIHSDWITTRCGWLHEMFWSSFMSSPSSHIALLHNLLVQIAQRIKCIQQVTHTHTHDKLPVKRTESLVRLMQCREKSGCKKDGKAQETPTNPSRAHTHTHTATQCKQSKHYYNQTEPPFVFLTAQFMWMWMFLSLSSSVDE